MKIFHAIIIASLLKIFFYRQTELKSNELLIFIFIFEKMYYFNATNYFFSRQCHQKFAPGRSAFSKFYSHVVIFFLSLLYHKINVCVFTSIKFKLFYRCDFAVFIYIFYCLKIFYCYTSESIGNKLHVHIYLCLCAFDILTFFSSFILFFLFLA